MRPSADAAPTHLGITHPLQQQTHTGSRVGPVQRFELHLQIVFRDYTRGDAGPDG
jgi:hypothetical protein